MANFITLLQKYDPLVIVLLVLERRLSRVQSGFTFALRELIPRFMARPTTAHPLRAGKDSPDKAMSS